MGNQRTFASLAWNGKGKVSRKYRDDPPIIVPADDWEHLDASPIRLTPARKKAFERGVIYQFVYLATGPKVTGIGFAAVRDFVSFLRHATADASGTANSPVSSVNWSVATGLSQSGRFHRPFLYLGFNQDEQGGRFSTA